MTNAIEKELGKLININEDACEFYSSAREQAESAQLQTTFSNLESLHNSVIINLQQHVRENGGDPEVDETVVGKTQQFWGELMTKISNDVDETLVTHLEEAEDRCLHSIKDAMNDDDLPVKTKAALEKELTALQKSHDYMKSLKDMMKAA